MGDRPSEQNVGVTPLAGSEPTLTELLEWARTQPAEVEYPYYEICGCAFYQFLKARGYPVSSSGGGGFWVDKKDNEHEADIPFSVLADLPHTFGALVERIEQVSA